MKRARRFPQRLIRSASWCVSLVLIYSALFPFPAINAKAFINRASTSSKSGQQGPESNAASNRVFVSRGNSQNRGTTTFPPPPQRQAPQPPPTKPEREARVSRIQLSVDKERWVASGERFSIGAVPLDRNGEPIHGLRVEWSTSDKNIVFVTKDGQAIGGKVGTANLIAHAGNTEQSVKINVYDAGPDRKQPVAASKQAKREFFARRSGKRMFAHAAMPAPPDDRLPDSETNTLYQPPNKVGKPPGKTEAVATKSAAANDAVETPGSANYTFGLGIEGLPGRQLDAGLGLSYNSRVWHKVVSGSTTKVYFDVDYGWPAPGFRLGYGQIEYQGTAGFTLTDPDGTRHQMTSIGTNKYRTTDGSIITFDGNQYGGTVTYPDGTHVFYGATSGPRSYPTRVTDRHGNYIDIAYVNNAGPKISSVVDTLGRYFLFYYSGNDLIAITAPGYNNGAARQVIRFYYETMTFQPFSLFMPGVVQVTCPTETRILRYVYMPGTQSGYRYDYSPYGMIRKTSQLRGMAVDTTSLTSMGSVTSDGQVAATSEYDYTIYMQNLTDVPKFYSRTDDWAGRTTASPAGWAFASDEANGITTVTSPENVTTETQSNTTDGQIQSVTIKYQGAVLSKVSYFWESSTVGPRLQKIETTNEANQTRATSFAYDPATIFNNVSAVSEKDFAPPGTLGTELRRTETTYENSTNYTNRGLIHLPKSVKVFAGGSGTPSSHTEYSYDAGTLVDRVGIIMYDPAYNPYSEPQEQCNWQWNGYDYDWVCNYYPVYDPSTAYRGNVTNVTSYGDAANTAGAQTNTLSYDIAGNVTEQTVNCCRRKTYGYSSSYYFAYATSETRGDSGQLTTSATFDFNTGLLRTATDENAQTSTIHYYPESLRYHRTDFPDGGYSAIEYNDALVADPDATHMHSSTMSTIATGTTTVIRSYDYFDGRGAVVRRMGEFTAANGQAMSDIEYDELGRVKRVSNPYYATTGTATAINPTGIWTTNTFDKLGRVTRVDMPSGDAQNPTMANVQTDPVGSVTTVTDQAGKQRRQIVDALGRVVRLDEPDLNGNLGALATPALPTSYEYDTLDNLIHITQGGQQRYFKYDSLSRLTHDRQVEQDAPWTTPDSVAGNNQWSRKIIYNSQSLIEDAYDARQRRTNFVYDGLNRVKEIHYFGANGQPDPATPDAFYWYDAQTLPPGAPVYDRGYSTDRLVAMTYGGTTANPNPTGNYFGYDKMGSVLRQRQVTGSNTYLLSYTYNLAGQLTSETYPSNRVLSYAYDEAGRLSQVSEGTSIYANGFAYKPHGGLGSETFGNGMVRSLDYNRRLQPSEVKLKQSAAGAELQRYNYLYGQVNQTDGSIDTAKNNGQIGRIDGYINGAKQWDQRTVYDSLGRLSTASEYRGDTGAQTWQAQYTFDRFGNRLQSGSGNTGISYIPVVSGDIDGNRNRLVSTGGTPTTYDPAGNILTDARFRGMNYQYDANGRQTFAERTDHTNQQTSLYDCAGQRVQTTAGSVTRTMVYDIFGQNVADYLGTSSPTLERENIYRGGQLLVIAEAGSGGNHSLALNGSTGYVQVPSSTSLNITGAITLEAWIKPNSTGTYQNIIARESWSQSGTGGGYELSLTNLGKVRLDLYQSHNTYTPAIGNTTVSTGAWHHVAAVFDGSQMRIYLDGVLDQTVSSTSAPASGSSSLKIGRASYGDYFNGLIDEARVSNAAVYTSNFTPTSLTASGNTKGLWKFDGQTANDSSGNANNGTVNGGATYSTDVPPTQSTAYYAGSFNGTTAYVQVPSSTSLNITGAITLEAWIKPNSTGAYQNIITRESWSQSGTGGGYQLSLTNLGKVRLDLYQSHNTYTPAIGNTTVSTGTWHHVAAVFDGSQMRIYLDGVLDQTVSSTSAPASGTSSLKIGRASYGDYFNGLIDEARVSNAAIYTSNFTPQQHLTASGSTAGLWKFDCQTPNDSSVNANNGTLQGGATYVSDVPGGGGGGSCGGGGGGTTGGLWYVLSDIQGSARAVMNNSGVGTSTIIARHDYLPFGEEIAANVGLRTPGQGYGALDTNRWKYGMTERDSTGLDHTWWRKYENTSGRWTSPDPLKGSIGNPQSFNAYSYTQNDPVNAIDPTGLMTCMIDGMVYDCGLAFAVVNMGAGSVRSGFYGDGQVLVVNYPTLIDRIPSWQRLYLFFAPQNPPQRPRAPNPVLDKISEILNRPPSEREQKIQDCFNKKKAELDQARERFRNGAGRRILIQGAIRGGQGVVMGAVGGGIGGGAFFGVGAVPGAILGGVVGGVLGAGAGVLSGGFVVEPVRRAYYNSNYDRALEQAKADCNAQF